MLKALQLATIVLDLVPAVVAAGKDVKGIVDSTNATLKKAQAENRDITPGEWDAMNAQIEALRKELHA